MSFPLPATPALTAAARPLYAPNFQAGPTGLDTTRVWRKAVLDGETYVVNGYDRPRRWDRALNKFAFMGAAAPTTFALALSSAGSPAAIPTGVTARYYLVFVNSTLNKESAPQGGGDVSIANVSGATRDVTVTWTGSEGAVDQDFVRIYRALDGTDDYKRVAQVAIATGTYLDVTPDATLRSNGSLAWDGATRTTLPGADTCGIASSGNRLFLWNRTYGGLFFGELVRASGVSVVEDVRSLNILPVGSNDDSGPPTAFRSFQSSDVVWKRRAIFEKSGVDPTTWRCLPLTTARGTFNPKTVVPVGSRFICLDELGIYEWEPSFYSGDLGSLTGVFHAPFQPYFDRMNLAAADTFHALHFEQAGIVVFFAALDEEPQPNVGFVYDYGGKKMVGLVTRRVPSASGRLDDSSGVRHYHFGDDLGWLWEDLYGNSEGVVSGDSLAALTSASTLSLTASGAAFTSTINGPIGTPLMRVNSAGAIVDENRVYANGTSVLQTLLFPTTAYAAGDFVALGVVGGLFETAKINMGTHHPKIVRGLWIECAYQAGGTIRVDTALDDADFVYRLETSLSGTNPNDSSGVVRFFVPLSDSCNWWRLRISGRWSALPFSIRSVTAIYEVLKGARS